MEREQHVRAAREYDERHAVLLVREAPRFGATLANGDGRSLRGYLESRQQIYRPSTGKIVFATDHFLLDAVSEAQQERQTVLFNYRTPIIQTSAASGRRPRVYSYIGHLLLNDVEPSALSEWKSAWENYLRCSRSVVDAGRRDRAIPLVVELWWRDQIRRGYLLTQALDTHSLTEVSATVSFDMFVIYQATAGYVATTTATAQAASSSTSLSQALRPSPQRPTSTLAPWVDWQLRPAN